MMGCNPGRYISRAIRKFSNKRTMMRNNSIHRLRNLILCFILLSILPYKPISNIWTRIHLTTYRDPTTQPYTSTPIKYSDPTSIRGNSNMSSSWTARKQCHASNPRIILHCFIGFILYRITSLWILWSTIHNCRLSIRINVFCSNSKVTPIQALRVPGVWGSQILRQSAHEVGKVVNPMHWLPLPTRKHSLYSFLLEAEATPGPQCGRKDYVNEKFQWHHRE
jgi:hypothetical protein